MEMMSGKWKQEKQTKNQQDRMSCNDFDWYKMLDDGELIEKQRVAILTKYIDHYQLPIVRNIN